MSEDTHCPGPSRRVARAQSRCAVCPPAGARGRTTRNAQLGNRIPADAGRSPPPPPSAALTPRRGRPDPRCRRPVTVLGWNAPAGSPLGAGWLDRACSWCFPGPTRHPCTFSSPSRIWPTPGSGRMPLRSLRDAGSQLSLPSWPCPATGAHHSGSLRGRPDRPRNDEKRIGVTMPGQPPGSGVGSPPAATAPASGLGSPGPSPSSRPSATPRPTESDDDSPAPSDSGGGGGDDGGGDDGGAVTTGAAGAAGTGRGVCSAPLR